MMVTMSLMVPAVTATKLPLLLLGEAEKSVITDYVRERETVLTAPDCQAEGRNVSDCSRRLAPGHAVQAQPASRSPQGPCRLRPVSPHCSEARSRKTRD